MANGYGASPFGFEDLKVYQAAALLRRQVYELAKALPADERFSLVQQMRRAAVSMTNNLAEGHGRFSRQDMVRFCRTSKGSLLEIVDDLNVCADEGYLEPAVVEAARAQAAEVNRLLNGYVRYLRRSAGSGS